MTTGEIGPAPLGELASFGLALVGGALFTWILALLAARLAWTDDGRSAPERKLQRRAVPLVGGAAILGVLVVAWPGFTGAEPGSTASWFAVPSALQARFTAEGSLALLAAFVLGLIDDLAPRGLSARAKLAGQIAVAFLCARHAAGLAPDIGAGEIAARFALALLAQNAFNTFDNADGAATALGAFGAAATTPFLAAPLLGFLPFNLWLRRAAPPQAAETHAAETHAAETHAAETHAAETNAAETHAAETNAAETNAAETNAAEAGAAGTSRAATTPWAYLGDAGSHLLGVLFALAPIGWAASLAVLLLPLLDLARLAGVRLRRGSRPWIGDRRHLAHRLQAARLGPTAVVLVLLGIAAPAILAAAFSGRTAGPGWVLPAGFAATFALFVLAVRSTPDVP